MISKQYYVIEQLLIASRETVSYKNTKVYFPLPIPMLLICILKQGFISVLDVVSRIRMSCLSAVLLINIRDQPNKINRTYPERLRVCVVHKTAVYRLIKIS